jgi:class 3 adenylate cyclase/tetratricopeptide (TPR) repeat protein
MNCPRCRHENPPRAKFCLECAASLAATQPVAALLEKEKDAPEGERRRVTVLFADFESLPLVASRDAEEARAILERLLQRMMEAVHRYGGTVNQILSDGIMALFGAPLAHEDHALRACYAALRMQETTQMKIRVGVSSGEVLVRATAGDRPMDYAAVGQTTHLAARMQQMAEPGSILATTDVLRLVEGYVHARSLGERAVKGLTRPIELFEIDGAAPVRTRAQLGARRGFSPFVGRQAELTRLTRALELARIGQGQAAQLIGEPGVGKSRLLWEFVAAQRSAGWTVVESSALSHGRASAYFPIVELLARRFGIEPADTPATLRERLPAPLPALFDADPGDPLWASLDPPQRHRRIADAVKAVLIPPADAPPTILVLEDLHHIDAQSQDVLNSIVKALPGTRTLLLVEHRPEYSPDWASLSYCLALHVEPLPQASARELFRGLAGDDPSLGPLERRLLERTEGNAFFLEESVRSLAQSGALEGAPGSYRLARPLDSIEIPEMVQDVLAARLDLLPAADKLLLQLASVVGRDASVDVLARVSGLAGDVLSAALARLQSTGFLAEASLFPELAYTFKHAFTHEVAYASLSHRRRRRLHGEILDAMEALYAGKLNDRVELLAHHAVQGERWERAIPYLRRAAARAYDRSAYRDAARALDQAIRAVGHLPAGREAFELAVDLRLELRNPLLALGALDRIAASLREAEPVAEALGGDMRRARVAAHSTGYFWLTGQQEAAAKAGERALAVAAARAEPSLIIPTRFYLGAARHSMGAYRQAAELLEQNAAFLRGAPANHRFGMAGLPAVFSRAWLAWSRAELGEFSAAMKDAQEAVRIATAAGQMFSILAANFAVAIVHMTRGQVPEALRVAETGLATARAERMPLWVPPFATQLGLALARSARVPDALALLEKTLPAPSDAITFTPFAQAVLSEVYLMAGRLEDAELQGHRALERARKRQEYGYEGWALRLLGEIAASGDPPDPAAAEKHYRDALARANDLGMRPLAARCHLGLGDAQTAQAMFKEMGMTYWLPKGRKAR